jgi:hypothetical protein
MSRAGFNQSIKLLVNAYLAECDLLVTERKTQPFLTGCFVRPYDDD